MFFSGGRRREVHLFQPESVLNTVVGLIHVYTHVCTCGCTHRAMHLLMQVYTCVCVCISFLLITQALGYKVPPYRLRR